MNIPILLFTLLELSNVYFLYFDHTSTLGNGVGIFSPIMNTSTSTKTSKDELIDYLIYWVAGCKLMFLSILFIIGLFGNKEIQTLTYFAIALTAMSYFYKLSPIIKDLDDKNLINPKGYSKTLDMIIYVIILFFLFLGLKDIYNNYK